MAKGNKNARAVQRATGWRYTRALRFVKDERHSNEAGGYMKDQGITKREAFVALAEAESELGLPEVVQHPE